MEVNACKAYRKLASTSLRKSKPSAPAKHRRPKLPGIVKDVGSGMLSKTPWLMQIQRFLPGISGKLTGGLLAGLTLICLAMSCRGRSRCRTRTGRSHSRSHPRPEQTSTNRDDVIPLGETGTKEVTPRVKGPRSRLLLKVLGLLLILRFCLILATPEVVTNNSKHLRCPEFGHLGACRDLCLGQYGSLGLGHILYLQVVLNILLVGHYMYNKLKQPPTKGAPTRHLLSLILGDIGIMILILCLSRKRTPNLTLREFLHSAQLVPPFFDCDTEPPLFTVNGRLDVLWNTYQESCKFNYPRCKVEQPELQARFIKGHVILNLVIITCCSLKLGHMIYKKLQRQAVRRNHPRFGKRNGEGKREVDPGSSELKSW